MYIVSEGHYALTGHLLHLLRKSPASRVVTVSSAAHLLADKDISSDPNVIISKPNYEPWTAYGNSKLANILFTKKLAALLPQNITPLVCHPGSVLIFLCILIYIIFSIIN